MSTGGLSKARLGRMHDVMAGHVERGGVPGLVTLVSRRGEAHVDAIGMKAAGGRDRMRRDTIFRISSMTKPIAAAAAMILVEECRLRLDEPVDRLLPELAGRKVLKRLDAKRPISVRDLLTLRDDYLAFGQMMLNKGKHGSERVLSRPSVESMTTDQLTPEQKAVSGLVPGYFDCHGWGFGVSMVTRRDDVAGSVGRFGWDGGLGTSWRSDPKEEMVAILMTQRASPPVLRVSASISGPRPTRRSTTEAPERRWTSPLLRLGISRPARSSSARQRSRETHASASYSSSAPPRARVDRRRPSRGDESGASRGLPVGSAASQNLASSGF